MKKSTRAVMALLAIVFAVASAGPAYATGGGGKKKCNAGNGNGSEVVRGEDCDPGNSGENNNGKD